MLRMPVLQRIFLISMLILLIASVDRLVRILRAPSTEADAFATGAAEIIYSHPSTNSVDKDVPVAAWLPLAEQRPITWGEFLQSKPVTAGSSSTVLPVSASTLIIAATGTVKAKPLVCSREKLSRLSKNVTESCESMWGNTLLSKWKARQVEGLCEPSAESSIQCFDSPVGQSSAASTQPSDVVDTTATATATTNANPSRLCVFSNALISFKKTRLKSRSDGSRSRAFERGFLSAQCGDTAKDNIGLPLYTPDIEDHHDATCHFQFNETVLVFSHVDPHSLSKMTNDYLNILLMLRLGNFLPATAATASSNTQKWTKRLTLLNIDSIRKGGRYMGDEPTELFDVYGRLFGRVIRAAELGPQSKACFKSLVMPPRPVVNFLPSLPLSLASTNLGSTVEASTTALETVCSNAAPSQLYQQLNALLRLGLPPPPTPSTPTSFSSLPRVVILDAFSASAIDSLRQQLADEAVLVVIDRKSAPHNISAHKDVIDSVMSASVLLASTPDDLAAMFYLPLGSPRCCSVLQMTASSTTADSWGSTARFLGFHYRHLNVVPAAASVDVDVSALGVAIRDVLRAADAAPSCVA